MCHIFLLCRYGARMVGGDLIVATYKQDGKNDDRNIERSESERSPLSSEPCMYRFTRPKDSLSVADSDIIPSPLRDIVAAAAEIVGGLCGSLQMPVPADWLVGGSASAPLSSPHCLHLSPGNPNPSLELGLVLLFCSTLIYCWHVMLLHACRLETGLIITVHSHILIVGYLSCSLARRSSI